MGAPPVHLNAPGIALGFSADFQVVKLQDFFAAYQANKSKSSIALSLDGARHVEIDNRMVHPVRADFVPALGGAYTVIVEPNRRLMRSLPFEVITLKLTDLVYNPSVIPAEAGRNPLGGDRHSGQLPFKTPVAAGLANLQDMRGGYVAVTSASAPIRGSETVRSTSAPANFMQSTSTAGPFSLSADGGLTVGAVGVVASGLFTKLYLWNPTATALAVTTTDFNSVAITTFSLPAQVPFSTIDLEFYNVGGTLVAGQAIAVVQQVATYPPSFAGGGI